MRSRTIAVAGSIAALSFAAVPIAQAASTHHRPVESRLDRSRDTTGARHVEKTHDRRSLDGKRDRHDR